MKFQLTTLSLALLPRRLQGMFNLNDPRWGRNDDKSDENSHATADRPQPAASESPKDEERKPQGSGNQGPPDLD